MSTAVDDSSDETSPVETKAGAVGSTCDRCGDCVDPLTLAIVGVPAKLVCGPCAERERAGAWRGALRAGVWAEGLGGALGVVFGLLVLGLAFGPLGAEPAGFVFLLVSGAMVVPVIAVFVGLLLSLSFALRGGLPHGPRPLIERAARTAGWGVGLFAVIALLARVIR